MESNVIEVIESVMHDARALEQDFAKMLDDLGCSLFTNKLQNLQNRAEAFAGVTGGHPSKPGARWYEEMPTAQLKSMPDLYRCFEKTLGKNDKVCNSIDADIDVMIQHIDELENLQGSLKGLVVSMDMGCEFPAKTRAKEVKDIMVSTRVEAHCILAWHGTATASKDQRMKAIKIVHTWMSDKNGDTKQLLPKIRELLQEAAAHQPDQQASKRQKLKF